MNRSFSGAADDSAGRSSQGSSGERSLTDSRLMEKVLKETVSAAEAELPANADWHSLLQVARRHRGRPFSVEPVLLEMVASLLRLRAAHIRLATDAQQAMVQRIAATIYDD